MIRDQLYWIKYSLIYKMARLLNSLAYAKYYHKHDPLLFDTRD